MRATTHPVHGPSLAGTPAGARGARGSTTASRSSRETASSCTAGKRPVVLARTRNPARAGTGACRFRLSLAPHPQFWSSPAERASKRRKSPFAR